MTAVLAFRYFLAVTPPAAPLVAVLAILVVAAAGLESVSRGSSDWVLASIALVQLFTASTGFTRHASRGYYDPLLIGARGRGRLALAHFAASAWAGAAAWTGAGIAQALAAGSASVPAFRPSGWAALLLASAVPWAASVRLPPFVAGALWVLLTASLLVSGKILPGLSLLHAEPAWAREHPFGALAVGLAFPLAIPEVEWPPAILGGFAAFALAALAAGWLAVARAEFPLAEEGM